MAGGLSWTTLPLRVLPGPLHVVTPAESLEIASAPKVLSITNDQKNANQNYSYHLTPSGWLLSKQKF